MSSFHFELGLCLHSHIAPMVKQTLIGIGSYGLAEGLDHLNLEEETEADLVSFKGSAEHWWTHQALDLPSKSWVLHNNKIPLILRIRERANAKQKAAPSRLPKQPDCLVLLKVRKQAPPHLELHQPNELGPHRLFGEQDWHLGAVLQGVGEGHQEPPELTGAWSAETGSMSFW